MAKPGTIGERLPGEIRSMASPPAFEKVDELIASLLILDGLHPAPVADLLRVKARRALPAFDDGIVALLREAGESGEAV